MSDITAGFLTISIVVVLSLGLYFLPFLIALSRKKQNTLAIFALNVLLGWTLLGWAIAFVWSLMKDAERTP